MVENFTNQWLKSIEQGLMAEIQALPSDQERLKAAMTYAVAAGGKRLRPILLLATCQLAGGNPHDCLAMALALEMIHTYSLIHDDLPGMDNDDLRRGKPTLHIQFDQATAILAGDAFLTMAFELASKAKISDREKVSLLARLSHYAGPSGMIAGQMLDIQSETQDIRLEQLEKIHQEKTGKLILFAVEAGLAFGNLSNLENHALISYAKHYGLAFQIQNDLQDVLWDTNQSGKVVGKDQELEKNTYPSLLGVEGALAYLQEQSQAARKNLHVIKETTMQEKQAKEVLVSLLDYLHI